ncbi:MAG: glutaredoxin family protein [Acidobacteria bacterium]|nr:glutaredoxin family protein [Acidobacteriota bacterium]
MAELERQWGPLSAIWRRGGFLSKRSSLWTEYYGDESALKELQELGVFSTPVTLINGAVVVGFDRDKLEQLLGLTG